MNHNNNIKIMKTKPTLSDEEIHSHMDFDKLLQLHKTGAVSTTPKWLKITGYVAPAALVISVLIYSLWPSNEVVSENQLNMETPKVQADSTIIAKHQVENEKQEIKSELETVKDETELVQKQSVPTKKSVTPIVPEFTEAEPINGYPDLYAYFERELKYPVEALKDSVEGVVSVSFAINENGKPTDIRITNSLGTLFDAECKRIIESMPAWKAATINGKPTATRLSIPLTFRIIKK